MYSVFAHISILFVSIAQYFKHSNYGSFVRQLNLYGFTSSRLKERNDVVVWTHDNFRRDRQDLLKDITRTNKKAKSAGKPSHVHIHSPSPTSYASASDESASNHIVGKGGKASIDQRWLESEFAYLKQQNQLLEQKLNTIERTVERKLDTLLTITLRISPLVSEVDESQAAGQKRHRKMSPADKTDVSSYNRITNPRSFNDGIEPAPYEESKMDTVREMLQHQSSDQNGVTAIESSRDDSYKHFIDIMLNDNNEHEESKEEALPLQKSARKKKRVASSHAEVVNNTQIMPAPSLDSFDDELMQEALEVMHPGASLEAVLDVNDNENANEDMFVLNPGVSEEMPTTQLHQSNSNNPTAAGIVTMANANIGKASGPAPISSSSNNQPTTDIEEGSMSHGVHVIEARAELVEDGDQFFERDGYTHRKKIGCILGFMLLVIIIGVITTPVVISSKKREYKSKQLHFSGKSHKGPPELGLGQHTSTGTSNDVAWKDDGYGKPCLFGRCDDKLQDISNKLDEVLNQQNVSTTEDIEDKPSLFDEKTNEPIDETTQVVNQIQNSTAEENNEDENRPEVTLDLANAFEKWNEEKLQEDQLLIGADSVTQVTSDKWKDDNPGTRSNSLTFSVIIDGEHEYVCTHL